MYTRSTNIYLWAAWKFFRWIQRIFRCSPLLREAGLAQYGCHAKPMGEGHQAHMRVARATPEHLGSSFLSNK